MFNRSKSFLRSAQAKVTAIAALGSTALVAVPSFAQSTGPDVTAVIGAITSAGTAVATIGSAVLVLIVGIKVWKWLGRAT